MSKHNKKRNVGIVYELLIEHITKNLVEGNKQEAKKATKIVEKYFKKGTELYKEYRLFNALASTNASGTHIVASILNEAKTASKKFDKQKLEKEKSNLIREINYTLNKSVYYTKIDNYRDLGTVQLALNEWRKEDRDIRKLVDYETKIGEIMLKEKKSSIVDTDELASHSDRLVLKLMMEKFNKRHGVSLSGDQKAIVENYVFYHDKNSSKLTEFFDTKKKEVLNRLTLFESETKSKYLLEKIGSVRSKILEVKTDVIDDTSVMKFLSLTQLISEFKKEV